MAAGSVLTTGRTVFPGVLSLHKSIPVPVELSLVPEKKSGTVEEIQNDQIILTNPHNTTLMLNNVGAIIWSCIDGRRSCNHIADHLSDEFNIDRCDASRDVESFLTNLEKEGFIELRKKSPCYSYDS